MTRNLRAWLRRLERKDDTVILIPLNEGSTVRFSQADYRDAYLNAYERAVGGADVRRRRGSRGRWRLRRRVSSSSVGLEILEGTKGSRGKKKSRRAVYLMPEAVAALKVHRLRYLEEREKRADRWEATWQKRPEARDLVFPSTVGGPMSRNNLARRHFKPLAQRAGLPEDATLYTLRHTFATLWLESKEPVKVLQEILGHSRIDVTMNVYAHVLPHIQEEEEVMGRFAERLRGAGSTPAGT